MTGGGAMPPEGGADTLTVPDDLCDYAGHEWFPAGGGLLICGRCEAEKWAEDDDGGADRDA